MPRRPKSPDAPFSERISRIGFIALFGLIPLVYDADLYSFSLLPKRLLTQAIAFVIAVFWLLDDRSGRQSLWRTTRLHLPIALVLLLTLFAFSQAVNPIAGLLSISHQLTFAILFLIVVNTFPTSAIPGILRVSACAGILVSLLGILEYWGADMAWLPSNGRPSATFAYRNLAASYLIMNIPLALALWIRSTNIRDLCLGSIATGMMVVFLAYTRTRGAWVGLTGSALIIVFVLTYARLRWRTSFDLSGSILRIRDLCLGLISAGMMAVFRGYTATWGAWAWIGLVGSALALIFILAYARTRLGTAVSLMVILLCVNLSSLSPRITAPHARAIDEKKAELVDALASAKNPGADRGRLAMWRHTWQMIGDHPLFGVGPGNWQVAYPPYDGGEMLKPGSAPERPHNDFLWIASEIGLPGLAVYLWLLVAAAVTTVRIIRRPSNPEYTLYAVAFGASILAMIGHSLFSFPRERIETSALFWAGLGILALLDAPQHAIQKRRDTARIARPVIHLIPVLLLLSGWLTYRHVQFDSHYLLSLQYYKGGDFRSVLQASSNALQYGPFHAQAFLMRNKGHQSVGMLQNARLDCLQGLRYHPYSIELLGDLGNCYAMLDSLDRAEACYKQALGLSYEYYQMYNNLGGVYQKRGNLSAAIDAYRRALERRPDYIDAYSNLGLAYLATGRPDEAIQTYRQALVHAPDDPVLYHNLGDAYFQKADQQPSALPLALEAYEQFLRTWRGPRADAETARQRIAEIQRRLSGDSR